MEIQPKTVLFRKIARIFSLEKLCKNRVKSGGLPVLSIDYVLTITTISYQKSRIPELSLPFPQGGNELIKIMLALKLQSKAYSLHFYYCDIQ